MDVVEEVFDEEQLKRKLAEAQQQKAATFEAHYRKLCEEYGMQRVGVPMFTQDGRVAIRYVVQELDNGQA